MSLKGKFFSFLTIAIGMVAFSGLTLAQDNKAVTPGTDKMEKRMKGEGRGFGKHKMGRDGKMGRHGGFRALHGINLTDTQKEQIRVIHENNKPDAAVMQEFKAMREARRAGTEITPEQKERMKAMRQQSKAKRMAVHEQVLAILTTEQKAQIEQKKAEMKQRRQEHKLRRQQNPAATTKPIEG